ncbi:hypothetical protein HDC94_001297 [Leifsonia sp. AK011]|uniref:hypothetical protein n=1 Tax=Leifsonia sp. AK011 TaxID=2723075 RepID=UPI0015CE63D6|nr:hypothetical protein [Leifsonia sp. AK011]NYF10141.1 hypothetical protein [Leifsonia sp. AK011]
MAPFVISPEIPLWVLAITGPIGIMGLWWTTRLWRVRIEFGGEQLRVIGYFWNRTIARDRIRSVSINPEFPYVRWSTASGLVLTTFLTPISVTGIDWSSSATRQRRRDVLTELRSWTGVAVDSDEDDDQEQPPPSGEELRVREEFVEEIAELARALTRESASVTTHSDFGVPVASIEPTRSGAAGMWIVCGHTINIQVDDPGLYWDLPWSFESRAQTMLMLRAVIAGSGTATAGPYRRALSLRLSDGTTLDSSRTTALRALVIPAPGWKSWGRKTALAPYR